MRTLFSVTEQIESCIAEFRLLEDREPCVLAFSGGKDSLTLALALRDLGHSVLPVAVDMTYSPKWGERVRNLGRSFGLPVEVRTPENVRQGNLKPDMARNLAVLRSIPRIGGPTPCTYCYNAKLLTISARAQEVGIRSIAFGHHQTDAIASLLKAAFMYEDRWICGNDRYVRANFESLVDDYVLRSSSWNCRSGDLADFLEWIGSLMRQKIAGTDEPPRQNIEDKAILRPMFLVSETSIESRIAQLPVRPESSGCGHGATKASETPRQMIHFRLLRQLHRTMEGRRVEDRIAAILKASLTADGCTDSRARSLRTKLLGATYKQAIAGISKL